MEAKEQLLASVKTFNDQLGIITGVVARMELYSSLEKEEGLTPVAERSRINIKNLKERLETMERVVTGLNILHGLCEDVYEAYTLYLEEQADQVRK